LIGPRAQRATIHERAGGFTCPRPTRRGAQPGVRTIVVEKRPDVEQLVAVDASFFELAGTLLTGNEQRGQRGRRRRFKDFSQRQVRLKSFPHTRDELCG